MAGDWIKMRVLISRDPKTIGMADFLAGEREFMHWLTDPVRQSCKESAYEHNSHEVIVMITVSSLLITWGVARDRGHADELDLVLNHCTLESLDRIAGIPRFGAAMEFVGWAHEDEGDPDCVRVRLPNFFRDNAPVEEIRRETHAEAQRRYRKKKKEQTSSGDRTRDSGSDITVTSQSDLEKRREEKSNKAPPTPQGGNAGGFDRFWKAYPRKTAKAKAAQAWRQLAPSPDLQALILAAVERQKAWGQWLRGVIPHAATWLNQRRWEDEGSDAAPALSEEERRQRVQAQREAAARQAAAARGGVHSLGETLFDVGKGGGG